MCLKGHSRRQSHAVSGERASKSFHPNTDLNKGHGPDGEFCGEAMVSQQGSPAACNSWGPFHLREG